jgi:ABC transport system ATP-binding/permease protein
MPPRNLINAEGLAKSFGTKILLSDVSLGIGHGERIGVLGRNGAGKSSLMRILAKLESPDAGRVAHASDLRLGILSQGDDLPPGQTVEEVILGSAAKHQWASDAGIRDVFVGLFGGFDQEVLARPISRLSGGERRRVALVKLLISDINLLVLDEPSNHLDVEGVDWLAQHLKNRGNLSLLVVTHDRWFLDELCDRIWEVTKGSVEEYEGGYSAFVLAKAERGRQAATEEGRRANLIRKELAWLRRGAPARTSKPKFRVDAANVLIEGEPPPRDSSELLSFAGARLGKTVFELHDAAIDVGERRLFDHLTWNVGPGERIGVVGVNGAGKTTLMNVLAGERKLNAGRAVTGVTVKSAHLSQNLEDLDPTWRLLESVERVANRVDLGKGRELSALQLCERLGFDAETQSTPVAELSGGERRRLQLTRLLMDGPNVLLLDEPTNDLDIETLTSLEDLLDGFAGTILVVSHDRYFLERVCDRFVGVMGDGSLRDLPRGVEQYLELRRAAMQPAVSIVPSKSSSAATQRTARKEMARLERLIARKEEEIASLHNQLVEASTDYERLSALTSALEQCERERSMFEEEWLKAAAEAE